MVKDHEFSIPVENLSPLLNAIKAAMEMKGTMWTGYSEPVRQFLEDHQIHPPTHDDFKSYYSTKRHTLATSYVWGETKLQDIALEAQKPKHNGKQIWIDVLINKQFSIDSSSVMDLTEEVFSNCEVLIMLCKNIFYRGWCLYEAFIYVSRGCTLHTVGTCQEVVGVNFLVKMETGRMGEDSYNKDKELILKAIQKKFGTNYEERFNKSVENAIWTVNTESLLESGNFRRALELSAARLIANPEDRCLCLNKMGRAYDGLGLYLEALEKFGEQLKIEIESYGIIDVSVASTKMNMGSACFKLRRYEEARKYYEEAEQIKIEYLGYDHISVAESKSGIGLVYERLEKFEDALRTHQEVLAIKVKCLGNDHVSVSATKVNIGNVYVRQCNYEEALKSYEEALAIDVKCLGKNHIYVADAKNNIAIVYKKLEKYEDALKVHNEALGIKIECLGNDHVSVAETKNNIGEVYWHQKKYDDALKIYKEALDIYIPQLANCLVSAASTKNNIAMVYESMGKYTEALEWYEKALGIMIKCYGNNHVSVVSTTYRIGVVHLKNGDAEKAEEFFVKAHNMSSL